MRASYDNVIACGLVSRDIAPDTERVAGDEIEAAHAAGQIMRVTPRESWRKQERTRDNTRRSRLEAAGDLVSVVQADHRVLEFANINGPFGTIAANPIVPDRVDEALFADLKVLGLKHADARHFMYAAANRCG